MSAPAVAVSAKHNKLVIAWKDMRKGEPNIYWSISNPQSFNKGVIVHNSTEGKQDHPSATIDDNGVAWVAWEDSRNGKREVRVRSESSDSESVVGQQPNSGFPVIASGAGTVAVAYEAQQSDVSVIRFRVLNSPADRRSQDETSFQPNRAKQVSSDEPARR